MGSKSWEIRRKKKKEASDRTMHAINAVKFVALMTLRNQGWGDVRLKRFSDQFNELLEDVSSGKMSLTDLADTIHDETGLMMKDLRVE